MYNEKIVQLINTTFTRESVYGFYIFLRSISRPDIILFFYNETIREHFIAIIAAKAE